MTLTKSGFDVLLDTQPLKIIHDEQNAPQYREENLTGREVVEPQDGNHFVDVFTSWHKGGFVKEFVQDGYYFESVNVDATKVGEIKPGPARKMIVNIADGSTLDHYGVAGLAYSPDDGDVLAIIRKEAAAGTNLPNALTARWITPDYILDAAPATQGTELSTTAEDIDGTGTGYTNLAHPLEITVAGTRQYLVPCGDTYRAITSGALGSSVAVGAHFSIIQAGGRLFKISLTTIGEVGLSNASVLADLTAAASWTTPVQLSVFDYINGTFEPVSLSLGSIADIPYVGTPNGVFTIGPGGFPVNITPQYRHLPRGHWRNVSPLRPAAGGLVFGIYGRGHIVYVTSGFGAQIGPSANPLNSVESCNIMDIQEAPNGNLWVYVWFPLRSVSVQGVGSATPSANPWELWCGVKQPGADPGPGTYSWHSILREVPVEGGPLSFNYQAYRNDTLARPFLPVYWSGLSYQRPNMAFGVGSGEGATHTAGICNLMFTDGGLFFGDNTYESEHKGSSYSTKPLVQWRSGRYARRDRRVKRHWTKARFLGKNISAAPLTTDLQFASGSYIGDGSTTGRVIASLLSLGFTPLFASVKGDSVTDSAAVFHMFNMPNSRSTQDATATAAGLLLNVAGITVTFAAGDTQDTNRSGVRYYWWAIGGSAVINGSYTGGTASQVVSPAGAVDLKLLLLAPSGANALRWRTTVAAFGTKTGNFNAGPFTSDEVTALSATSFTLGTAVAPVNVAATTYYYCAVENKSNLITSSYVGTGVDDRSLTVGINADLFHTQGDAVDTTVWRTTTMGIGRDFSMRYLSVDGAPNMVQALGPDPRAAIAGAVQLGTDSGVNTLGTTYAYFAIGGSSTVNQAGSIAVTVSFDGGAFTTLGTIESNDASFNLNTVAYDVEFKLVWGLDGAQGAMRDFPATITQIMVEGRETPRTLRRITILCEGDKPRIFQVRRRDRMSTLEATLTTMSQTGGRKTFIDPFGVSRTVLVLPPTRLNTLQAKSMKVPDGSIQVELLEIN